MKLQHERDAHSHRIHLLQTLDMFGVLCRDRNYPMLRLDGSTSINKRQKLVKQFCDPAQNQFVFLLSSKVCKGSMSCSGCRW